MGALSPNGPAMLDFYHHNSPVDELPPLTSEDKVLLEELKQRVYRLAGEIGERNFLKPVGLLKAMADFETVWRDAEYDVQSQEYFVGRDMFTNLWVEIPGSKNPEEIVILGAHYDTVPGTPGADDNGTAVAAMMTMSLHARKWKPEKTLRFVAFANEEPPYFMTPNMGSMVYARQCRKNNDKIVGMLCLEMLGYYSDEEFSQQNIHGLLPNVGNFIGLVGNPESEALIRRAAQTFESKANFPMVAAAVPQSVSEMAGFSDHWSFWQFDYPAFMFTDTGPMRNPHYHLPSDTPDTIDYDRYTRVVKGVREVLKELAGC